MDQLLRDFRTGVRSLRRSRSYAAMAVLTLTLGIGVNAAILGVVDALLLRDPPGVAQPRQVRRVFQQFLQPFSNERHWLSVFSLPVFDDIEQAVSPRVTVAAFSAQGVALAVGEAASEGRATYVVGPYFELLRPRMLLGRWITPAEARPGHGDAIVIINETLWETRFGRDPGILGRTLSVDGTSARIVGVIARPFGGVELEASDCWLPFGVGMSSTELERLHNRANLRLRMLMRVPSDHDVAGVEGIVRRVLATSSPVGSLAARLAPLSESLDPWTGGGTARLLARLAAAAALILVIACTNLATLLLVRLSRRQRELAIRSALGASRGRLAAQVAMEGLIVVVTAGVAAFVTAAGTGSVLRNVLLPHVSWATALPGVRLAAIVGLLVLVVGVAAGVAAFAFVNERSMGSGLRLASSGSHAMPATQAVFVVVQAALSVILLAAAIVTVQSLRQIERVDLGFDPRNVIVAHTGPGPDSASFAAKDQLLHDVAGRVSRVPAVQRVGLTFTVPLISVSGGHLFRAGGDSVPVPPGTSMRSSTVSPDFFQAMGIPVRQGRTFTNADRAGSTPVIVVSERLARILAPHGSAVGTCVLVSRRHPTCRTIVGVVADVHEFKLIETQPLQYYVPLDQAQGITSFALAMVVRHRSRRDGVLPIIRQLLTADAPAAAGGANAWTITSYEDILEPQRRPWRISATLFGSFALLAVAVAAVGIYGVIAYATSLRLREIGIRRALGADSTGIGALVLRNTMTLVAGGTVLGIGIAIMGARFLEALLYGVSARNPATLAAAAAVIIGVAGLAGVEPLVRALRVDPKRALEAE